MVKIRLARIEDVKNLQSLNNEVFVDNKKYAHDLEMDWSLSDAGKEYYTTMSTDADALCLVAEEDGKKVGYLSAYPKTEVGRKSKYFEVNDMGVSPKYRSKGIGRKLLEECFKVAKSRGFDKVFVKVYSGNTKAIEFYKAAGLEEIELGLEIIL